MSFSPGVEVQGRAATPAPHDRHNLLLRRSSPPAGAACTAGAGAALELSGTAAEEPGTAWHCPPRHRSPWLCNSGREVTFPHKPCLPVGNPLETHDQRGAWGWHPQMTSCHRFPGLWLFINAPIRLEFKNALTFTTTEPSCPLNHLPHAKEFREGICYMRMVKFGSQNNLLQQYAEKRIKSWKSPFRLIVAVELGC